MFNRLLREETGILTFEWIMITVLLSIGLIAGLAGARSAFTVKLTQTAQATSDLKQSYDLQGLKATTTTPNTSGGASASYYSETKRSYFQNESNATVHATAVNVP